MGRRNLSGKKINKESYDYYTKNYNAQKSYYKRKGYTELIPTKMSKEEWSLKKKTGATNKQIIYEEFHKYSKEQAKRLQQEFIKSGEKAKLGEIARGQIEASQWSVIRNRYRELISEGNNSTQALALLSYQFWGS